MNPQPMLDFAAAIAMFARSDAHDYEVILPPPIGSSDPRKTSNFKASALHGFRFQ
jgi:hypothetical protein